jgi:peptidoglycan/xylan/chitin deacetylase (PgdA/CDA1 family)
VSGAGSVSTNERRPVMKRAVMLMISAVYGAAAKLSDSLGHGLGRQRFRRPVVLTYHSVPAEELDAFDWQMRHVAAVAHVVRADSQLPVNGRPMVAITFDDAFAHVFDRVIPILRKYDLPATIFVPTGHLGSAPRWIERQSTIDRVGPVVSASRLRQTHEEQVVLGSHSVSHPRLAAVSDAQLREELIASKRTLEELTGKTVDTLALPYGSYSAAVVTTAREVGYRHVFANVPIAETNAHHVLRGRIDVSAADWRAEFRLKVAGAYQWMGFGVPAKRAVLRLLGRMPPG